MASAAKIRYEKGKGQQSDPVPVAELARLLASGTISRKTRVWAPGMKNWTSISKCGDQKWYSEVVGDAAPAAHTECGNISANAQSTAKKV